MSTPTTETTTDYAKLGDDIERAKRDRWERQQKEGRDRRNREHDERRLAVVEPEIERLRAAIAERRPVVDKLEAMHAEAEAELQQVVDKTPGVAMATPAFKQAEERVRDLSTAYRQARETGAELIEGMGISERGHSYVVRHRETHPVLTEVAAELGAGDVDWAFPMAPMVETLHDLEGEARQLRRRLK